MDAAHRTADQSGPRQAVSFPLCVPEPRVPEARMPESRMPESHAAGAAARRRPEAALTPSCDPTEASSGDRLESLCFV
ncbi:hypothetical protein GCM10011611_06090 [Aliidongia dinghuensis]|uniref:Uncharacterized protein n=1 Tax=Aliidongia dinghuensis TaxID=1867774 RepID=A0A8J2YQ43_9PROT|nr:hypothetical protein GCM10011611_06090 [Aliidongia dinghuensis]